MAALYGIDIRIVNDHIQKIFENNEFELKQMEQIVSAYLDMAELQTMLHIPMTMADWEKRLNGFLTMWDHEILQDAGKVSAELAKRYVETEFEKYRIIQDRLYKSDFDRFPELENVVKETSQKRSDKSR